MAEKSLLIFDVDGTLVYSRRADSRCFAQTYEELFGQPFPSIDWLQYPHVTDTTIFGSVFRRQFKREVYPEELENFKVRFVERLQDARRRNPANFREVPGARETLQRLAADDRFALGVATGGFELPARYKLGHMKIDTDGFHMSFADDKITREDIIGESLQSAERSEGPFRRVVYVGDAVWDVRTTRNMNLNFVGIRWRGDFQMLQREGAGTVLRDYRNFDHFIEAVHRAGPPRSSAQI